jgi:DNA-binding NarL/FixJ family response regulator
MEKRLILLADDHEMMLDGLTAIIDQEDNLSVVATARTGREFILKATSVRPDICIVDLEMPDLNGLQASEILIQQFSDVKIIILTMHKEQSLLRKIRDLGIKGYLLKTCDSEELIFAINKILKGQSYYSGQIMNSIEPESNLASTAIARISQLTKRELEIVRLICQGYSNTKVATELFISPSTVDNHRTSIMRKLDVHNVAELLRFCINNKVV